MQHVIIGSGIAGLAAAEAIRARDASAAITMIGDEPHAFYSRPGLAYLLRGDVPERQLFIRTASDLRALAVNRIHARVDKLLVNDQLLELADGRRLAYDRLLIATGARATPPSFPGAELEGVVKLDNLDDARGILQACGRRQGAVVVGGGITALELAEGLCARGMRTHYLLRGRRYWSDVLDDVESQIVLDRLRHEGVRLHLETQVKQAIGEQGQLTAIETQSGERIACRILAVAIGVRPRIDFGPASRIDGRPRDRSQRVPANQRGQHLRRGRRGAGTRPPHRNRCARCAVAHRLEAGRVRWRQHGGSPRNLPQGNSLQRHAIGRLESHHRWRRRSGRQER